MGNAVDNEAARKPALLQLAQKCLGHFSIFPILFVPILSAVLLKAALSTPQYIASAQIAAPLGGSLSFPQGILGSSASLTQQLTGNGNSAELLTNFTQLLSSHQVAEDLATRYKVMPIVFYDSWDASRNDWRPKPAFVTAIRKTLTVFSHKTIKDHPDIDDLQTELGKRLSASKITPITSSGLLNSSNIIGVSFAFRDPGQAQMILSAVLDDADSIIRRTKKRDVAARISYLQNLLPTITATEERSSLISALTAQRQNMATIEADKRYASSLVVAPYTPVDPASSGPVALLLQSLVAALAGGLLAIYFLPVDGAIMRWFAARTPSFMRRAWRGEEY